MRADFLLSAAFALAIGCTPAPDAWPDVAEAADEASIVLASEMALLVVPGNLDPAATPEETATAAVLAAPDAFDPPTCVSATASGASVAYVLDGCVGSFGLVRVTGTMDVTFRADAEGLTAFGASATGLTLRGGTVSFTVDARVAHEAGTRTIDAATTSSGVSPEGRPFERTGVVTARWMDTWGCLFIDSATASTTLMGHAWEAEIGALTYCVGECPMVGGSMTWTRPGSDALHLEYSGMPAVHWSVGDASASGDLPIVCGV